MPFPQSQSPIRRIFGEAFNHGQLSVVDEELSPAQLTRNFDDGASNSKEGFKWLIGTFRTAFPDLYCTVEDEIREGEKLAAHWTMSGTHEGPFLGNSPTGKHMKIQGVIFARLVDGMIAEYWMRFDQYGLLQQLGIIPR